jgi:hypothetical protein
MWRTGTKKWRRYAAHRAMRVSGRFHLYTVRQLPQGAWELDVTREGQRVYGRTFPTRKEACDAAAMTWG